MTVAELIAKLEKLPPDAEIVAFGETEGARAIEGLDYAYVYREKAFPHLPDHEVITIEFGGPA